jgi:alpha/beta superfamily hydrolase
MRDSTTEITIETSNGVALQAELFVPDGARAAVVIAHPNPLMGGDMYTPVPSALWRALPDLGAAGVRFNFRGVGRSTGTHDHGRGEQLDVAAAIEAVVAAAPDVPLVLSGWSFGADVSLAIGDDRVQGWFLAAAPLKVIEPTAMAAASSGAPKLFAVPELDQFSPPAVVSAATAGWINTSLTVIEGADHFFGAQLPSLTAAFTAFVEGLMAS